MTKEHSPDRLDVKAFAKAGGHLSGHDTLLKYKRLEGVGTALGTLSGNLFANGRQNSVMADSLSSLGKPVLVMRDMTERPEAVAAGTVCLVGTDSQRIVAEVTRLLEDDAAYQAMSRAHNPYGDGEACRRILSALKNNQVTL